MEHSPRGALSEKYQVEGCYPQYGIIFVTLPVQSSTMIYASVLQVVFIHVSA